MSKTGEAECALKAGIPHEAMEHCICAVAGPGTVRDTFVRDERGELVHRTAPHCEGREHVLSDCHSSVKLFWELTSSRSVRFVKTPPWLSRQGTTRP